MLETLDEVVGRLVAALDKAGILEKTVIIFTGDNGTFINKNKVHMPEEFWDVPVSSAYPLREGKGTIYEGGTRVPLIVIWPGRVKPGSVSKALEQSTDFFPTFADMFGWKLPAGLSFDGVSLRPVLEKNKPVRNEIFCHFPHGHPSTSVRQGDWKLIRWYCDNTDQTDRFELYNLAEDLGETIDLASAQPLIVKRLAARINVFLKETSALIPIPNPAFNHKIR
jgi:arylsulfatase A-like enzyme